MLYMSPELDWARIAVATYMRADGVARVAVPLDLDRARVVDQRDENACRAFRIDPAASAQSWQAALKQGEHPPSWRNAALARAAGADGIIDPSRSIPRGWHFDLFRWNQPGAPNLSIAGEPIPVDLAGLDWVHK